MKIQTTFLNGSNLDLAVAMCMGLQAKIYQGSVFLSNLHRDKWIDDQGTFSPSILGRQGIELLTERCISTSYSPLREPKFRWKAYIRQIDNKKHYVVYGPTMLVAGTRCFVYSEAGETVDLPEGRI